MTPFSPKSAQNSSIPNFASSPASSDTSILEASASWLTSEMDADSSDNQQNASSLFKNPVGWWRGISIRRKATALAIALGVVPVVAMGGVSNQFVSSFIGENERQGQQARAVVVSQELAEIAAQRYQNVQVLAQTPFLTDARLRSQVSTEQQQKYFEQFLTQGINSIVLIDAKTGNALVEARKSDQQETFPNFKDIEYFQEVVRTKQPAIAPVRRSKATNELSFLVAAPVFDRDSGELLYVIRTRTATNYINEQIRSSLAFRAQQVGESEALNYFVTDGQGKVFVSDQTDLIEKSFSQAFPTFNSSPDRQAELAIEQSTIDNKDYVLGSTRLQSTDQLPDLKWNVFVAKDAAVVFAAQRQLLLTLVLGLGLTVMVVAAIATKLADRASRPLLEAAEAVEKIGQGDLETRLELERADEVGILSTNINTMAAQLQAAIATQAFEAGQERVIVAAKGWGVLRRDDLQALFDQAVVGARDLLKLDRVVIYRFNSGTERTVVSESVAPGFPSAVELNIKDTCFSSGLCDAYRQGRVVVTNNVVEADLHPDHLNLMERLKIKANIVVPIVASNELFGLLIAHDCTATREWQANEINFLQRLGSEIGLSIYRVDLLEQTTNLAEEQRQLKESLQKRALELLQEVDPISQGDLTTRAKVTADEIGTIADSYNATVDNLRKIVLQVQDAANQVVTTASINGTSIQTLSSEALRQAEAVQSAIDLVREMANAVQIVANNAHEAEVAVQQAARTVEEGDAVMNRTVEGIQGIRVTVADTAKKVKHLGESSQKISKVVELISAFAAQTNMLALNASIEASRAGEEGRGFAVVANEVRTLARQSAEATEEIRALVASIQTETNEVVSAMESGIEQVVNGTQLVDETRQSLNKITAISLQISGLVEAIARSTVVQSQASETVNQTMQGVAAIASKTSAEAAQVSSTFEQLRQVAQTLQADVQKFKV